MKTLLWKSSCWLVCALLMFQADDGAFAQSNQAPTAALTPLSADGSTTPLSDPTQLPLPLQGLSKVPLADLLGWTPGTSTPYNLCGSTYRVPILHYSLSVPGQTSKSATSQPTQITADQTTLARNGTSLLQGQVIISQFGQELQAEQAYLYPNPDSKSYQLQNVDLIGQVLIHQQDQILMGNSASYNLDEQSGTLFDATYLMKLKSLDPTLLAPPPNTAPVIIDNKMVWEPMVSWGQAQSVQQINPNLYHLTQGTYTTCSPVNPSWQIKGSSIDLNKLTGRGDAWNGLVYWQGLPIFYFPYFNFPIDNRRKTGLLYPTGGYTSTNGFELSLPIYLNLMPNYDATITPELMTDRGVLTTGNFRYLTGMSNGNFTFGFIPDDQGFKSFQETAPSEFGGTSDPTINARLNTLENDSDNRGMVQWNNNTTFNNNWSSTVNFNWVSDDYYLNDFGTNLQQTTTNQLLQQASVNYTGEHWDFLGNVENYQTLHPVNQSTVLNSYSELPQFLFTGDYPGLPYGLDFGMSDEYVDFVRQLNPGEINNPAEGSRINIQPELSLPLTWGMSGYFTPKIQLQATQYVLYSTGVTNPLLPISPSNPTFTNRDPTRVLPIFDIDSGLYFDRQTHLFGSEYTQTLEPRVFYLYVPYENQNNIPLFDTSLPAFDFNQLFQTNRFAGTDRVGDADQVSLALTTRFLNDATGEDKGSASIGQIIYFENRQVTLCRTAGCTDPNYDIGETSNTSLTSPLAGQLTYNLTPRWSAQANVAWAPNPAQFENTNFNVSYKSDSQHVLNLGYSFLRNGDIILTAPNGVPTPATPNSSQNNFNQPYVSFAWPITDHWSTIGYFDYDLSHRYAQQYFGGLQYNSCCYAVRFVASRQFQNLNQYNQPVMENEYYVQFLLKGLGSVGNADPVGLISQIAGYKDPFASNVI